MSSLIEFGRRNWTATHPPTPAKASDAIRIGLLGASWIAPQAVITPAKSHPGVIVAAIAARDLKKAQAYAKKHGIPVAFGSYQDLLDDPSIDAVYIPLPNGLHFEWTIRALRAGKHVLVEKPLVSNATEATSLMRIYASLSTAPSPPTAAPAPVLLEAVHYLFHPAWQTFLSLLAAAGGDVASARTTMSAPAHFFRKDDIRFSYALGGGALMDMGAYGASTLRQIFTDTPDRCVSATARPMPQGWDQLCDQAASATWAFPRDRVGVVDVDLAKARWGGLPALDTPAVVARLAEAPVPATESKGVVLGPGQSHVRVRTVTFWNFVAPVMWHRIDIVDEHVIRHDASEKLLKKWTVKESRKAYVWGPEIKTLEGKVRVGEPYWSTYRYMLEEFVNKINGRPGSGVWVDGQDSINGMVMIDEAYEKCGLPLRPTSTFE